MADLEIRLFGGLDLRRDGVAVPLPTPQRISLLAYLLLGGDRLHMRARVAGLFWGDKPETRAKQNLSDALSRLRKELEPVDLPDSASLFTKTNTHIGYNPAASAWVDVRLFLQLLGPQATIDEKLAAIELYSGPFLPGFYDEWLVLERDRLAALFCTAVSSLIVHYKAAGDWGAALDMAQRLVAADPLQEDATRELMKLHYRLGRRDRALAAYQTLRQRLASDLEVEPEGATSELRELIAASQMGSEELDPAPGDPARPPPLGAVPGSAPSDDMGQRLARLPLLGRDSERHHLSEWLSTPRGPHPPMLLLEGEAGVGKSSLARAAAAEAYDRGMAVLWGRHHELAAQLPYGGLVEALRTGLKLHGPPPLAPIWLSEVSRLLPELAAYHPDLPPAPILPEEQERIRLWEALVLYLLALGSNGPHLVIMEDVQWIDPATLDLLQYMLPRLMGGGFRLLATARSEDLAERPVLGDLLTGLAGNRVLARLEVERLEAETIIELARLAFGQDRPPTRFGMRLWGETQGNPFFVLETLRYWAERGVLKQQTDGKWTTPSASYDTYYEELPTPASVRHILVQRLQRIGRGARAVLELGAVLGDQVSEALLWRASGSGPEAMLAPTEELLHRQLWVEEGGGYVFAHNKVREVVYDHLSGPRKRHLHSLAATALAAERPANIEALAHHYSLAEDWGHALPYLLDAAGRARARAAHQQTISYYERALFALDHQPPDLLTPAEAGEHRFQLLDELGRLYHAVGRIEDAGANMDALLALAEETGRADWLAAAYTGRARFFSEQGRYPEALVAASESLRAARRGLQAAPPDDLTRAEAKYFSTISRIHIRAGNDRAALAADSEALVCYRRLGDQQGEAEALNQYGAVLGRSGDLDTATATLHEALALARLLGERRLEGRILNNLGLYASDPEESCNLMGRYLTISEEICDLLAQCMVHYNLAELQLRFGRYSAAQEHAERVLTLAENVNDMHTRGEALILRGQIWQALGDWGRARAEITRGLGVLQQIASPLSMMWAQMDLSQLFLEEGEWQRALANLDASYKQWQALDQPYGSDWAARFHAARARAYLGLRRPGEARKLVQEALAALAASGSAERVGWIDPSVEVLARCYSVLVVTGPERDAIAVLEQAHTRLEAVAMRCGPTLRHSYLEFVPECRLIRAAWAAHQAQLDGHGAAFAKKAAQRREQIVLLLADAQARGETLDDHALARILKFSLRQIQRDLAHLRASGRL